MFERERWKRWRGRRDGRWSRKVEGWEVTRLHSERWMVARWKGKVKGKGR